MKKILKNQRGLTLIELLAVIVILGIIAAIAVPSIGNIIENSRDKAVVTEAIQIIDAAKIARAGNPDQDTFTFTGGEEGSVALEDYLDKVKDKEFTVTHTDSGFTIKDHEANNKVTGVTEGVLLETELIDYIDGN